VAEHGAFQAKFYPRWRQDVFEAVLAHFRLDPKARAKHLSRGERAGLCLALTLAPDPELLILDDPTLGLDPVVRRGFIESIIYLTRREGRTVFFSSHQLGDVERVADRIGIMEGGVLRADCGIDSFRARVRRVRLRYPQALAADPQIPGLLHVRRVDSDLVVDFVEVEGSEAALRSVPAERADEPLLLEEAFVSYVGGPAGSRSFFDDMKGMP
jgi:ABC-2 type transport system ATP-binding protein